MPRKSKQKKKAETSEEEPIDDLEDEEDDEEDDEDGSDEEGSDEGDDDDDDDDDDSDDDDSDAEDADEESENTAKKNREKKAKSLVEFKKASTAWLDCDDRIKELTGLIKEQKDEKKEYEKKIIALMDRCGLKEQKIDVTDKNGKIRARVARQKSVTKSSIKDDQLKSVFMEILQSERKTDQAIKKVDSKRKVNERWYLKRTNGQGGNQTKKRRRKKGGDA